MPGADVRREQVRGEVLETTPPGGRHGAIAAAIATLLRLWIRQTIGGYVGVEAGYLLAHNPDTVRAPDVSYVRVERIPPGGAPEGFWDLAPVPIEVVSPNETAEDVWEKIRNFLGAGTLLVWTVYPHAREVSRWLWATSNRRPMFTCAREVSHIRQTALRTPSPTTIFSRFLMFCPDSPAPSAHCSSDPLRGERRRT